MGDSSSGDISRYLEILVSQLRTGHCWYPVGREGQEWPLVFYNAQVSPALTKSYLAQMNKAKDEKS